MVTTPPIDGLVVVDKAVGWTSHDVVARCRSLFGQKRIGHAGTLDPGATGVLVLGLGRVTRLLRYVGALAKSYRGEVVLGVETTTLDADGEVVATYDMSTVTLAAARVAATALVGTITQVPPMVSAVKVGGRRLYELARLGETVEREPRTVEVHRLQLDPTPDPAVLTLEVVCSSGTYVRTLAADLGRALGGGAHLRALRRTSIGSFSLADALPVEQMVPEIVLPPAVAMRDYPAATTDAATATLVRQGRVLEADVLGVTAEGPWPVLGPGGELLAVYERHGDGTVKPAVVVSPAG